MEPSLIDKAFLRNLKKFAKHGYDFSNGTKHQLRKGTQHEAFNGFTRGFNEGQRHGYFEIPTGVGKTAIFISLIKNYLDAVNGAPDAPRVLIVVPSTDLVIQTAKSIAKFMPDIAPKIEADDDQGRIIDWEKSDIGVQYGNMKHAARKPKVLITTYQSLCKDTNDKTYPPSEYGFVIYDEGHNTTAPKFGKAVEKFKNSIQLAVTATPEYSEDKTVAEKLPHCYFRLPLAKAINREDLCQVDPILIKTNYTIDKRKFEKFVEQQQGRFLTKAQYETLLNQEARNTAAIKTYLLGGDPHTGERYFGQTGMIFGGGVKHCDDFVRQIHKVINTPTYKPIRDWLQKEGIALIAPLHNKIKTVELTIDGQKRSYTKDEVKDLHRRGKVLLLISDKELKEGTDFPRDSIIMELVDRLSVVDATQRYGRGFRLDLPDPEHNNLGDKHKRCKVFNLVDNNTFEIYADKPQMLPLYCAEILEGAEFRKPLPRSHLIKRFKSDIPNVNDSLEKSGFEVVTDIERVREVSAKTKKAREKTELPEKEPDDLTLANELPKALGITTKNSKYIAWRNAVEAQLAAGETVTVGGHKIQQMRSDNNKYSKPFCLNRSALPTLAEKLGITLTGELPEKTIDDLTLASEVPNALGIGTGNPQYLAWRNKVEAQLAKGKTVTIGGCKIQQMHSYNRKPYCLNRAAIPSLAEKLGITFTAELPKKTTSDLTLADELPEALGVAPKNPQYFAWRKTVEAQLAKGETVTIGGCKIQQMQSGSHKSYCLNRAAIPSLAKKLDIKLTGELPVKTANDLALSEELPNALGIGRTNPQYLAWRSKVEARLAAGETVTIGDYAFQQMRSGTNHKPYCLNRAALPDLKRELEMLEDLKSKPVTPRPNPAHQSPEEREAQKRKGRER